MTENAIHEELIMKMPIEIPSAPLAVCTLADIKAAAAAFDRGESNVFEALDAIRVAIEAWAETHGASPRPRRRRDAA